MEAILQEHNNAMPAREILVALAEKFRFVEKTAFTARNIIVLIIIRDKKLLSNFIWYSASPDRVGKIVVQMKQV